MNKDSLNCNSSHINILKDKNQISDKTINHFAKQMIKETSQSNPAPPQFQQNESTKSITKFKDIEREI